MRQHEWCDGAVIFHDVALRESRSWIKDLSLIRQVNFGGRSGGARSHSTPD
jgi:hypothetical protein